MDEDEPVIAIQDHPTYCDLLDEIKKYANYTKAQLINHLYDDSGDGETKTLLKAYSFGELLVMVIDDIHGGEAH